MGLIFKSIKEGSWWLRCKSDKRWNKSGSGYVVGLAMPSACKEAIEKFV